MGTARKEYALRLRQAAREWAEHYASNYEPDPRYSTNRLSQYAETAVFMSAPDDAQDEFSDIQDRITLDYYESNGWPGQIGSRYG